MTILHIEHPITDFGRWKAAFDRLAQIRAQSGVRAHRVHRPLDDPRYVLIDLDFGTPEEARRFEQFLHEKVWASRENSPALAGSPQTRLLDLAEARPAAGNAAGS
jgi:hypothetical protein